MFELIIVGFIIGRFSAAPCIRTISVEEPR